MTSPTYTNNETFIPRVVQPGAKIPGWPGTCWHSVQDNNAFYSVHFAPTEIDHIIITNRGDCCQ